MNIVKIENGTYNNTEINGCFPLVKGITKSKDGSYFVKVKVSDSDEKVFAGRDACRIKIENQDQITEVSGSANKKLVETEDQAIERIAERFSILEEIQKFWISYLLYFTSLSGCHIQPCQGRDL